MTVDVVETSPAPSTAATRRVLLSRDDSGGWTLSGQGSPACRFPDLETALDSARHAPVSQTAAIEIWQGGEYICCLPPEESPHRGSLITTVPVASDGWVFSAVERYANRAAKVLMAAAGPVFWLALLCVAIAASLGWRLLLL